MDDFSLALLAGIEIPVEELQITIQPPRIKDIAFMTEEKFFSAVQYLCLDKEALFQDENVLVNLNNFQVLMKVLEQSQDKSKKATIITLLTVLFPDFRPIFTPNSLILSNLDDPQKNVVIDESNFEILQNILKQILCVSSIFQGQNIIYNPANAEAKRIADKIMRGRRKAAQLKAASNEHKSVLSRYISVLAIGEQYTFDYCFSLTLYQLFDLIERYNKKMEWDIDFKIRLTGTKPQSEVKNWMEDIH